MKRAFQVVREEGAGAFLRASLRRVLRWLRLYKDFSLPQALEEADHLWGTEPEFQPSDYNSSDENPQASIIVLTYNNLDHTRLCLKSIYACQDGTSFELILVDNASGDGTQDFLRQFAARHNNVKLILNTTNLGFSAGNNLGAAAASGDFIVFLNNDTIVTPGWLAGLVCHLQKAEVGMVGPRTNYWGNESRLHVRYTTLKGLMATAEQVKQAHSGQAFDIPMLALYCAAIRREVFETIGPLDERFGAGMFEDDDYAYRLRQKGYRILCAEDVFVHHWGKASFSKLAQERYRRLFEENRRKYEDKWGISWQEPGQANSRKTP